MSLDALQTEFDRVSRELECMPVTLDSPWGAPAPMNVLTPSRIRAQLDRLVDAAERRGLPPDDVAVARVKVDEAIVRLEAEVRLRLGGCHCP